MASEVTCRVLVRKPLTADTGTTPSEKLAEFSLQNCPDIPIETRIKWATGVIAAVQAASETPQRIRSWCLELHLDGTVRPGLAPVEGNVYPARFRIPANSLIGYSPRDAAKRAEFFALGSLLYEIETGQKPFEDLSDEEVQSKYSAGDFPEDVQYLKLGSLILIYWQSLTLQSQLKKSEDPPSPSNSQSLFSRLISTVVSHAQKRPVLFFFQVTGAILFVSCVAVLPALGLVGFGPLGPVAGSAAAAWQSSIGLVQAGSFFAWCQGVAMSGAALNGLFAAGLAGVGLAGGATLLASLDQAKLRERLQSYLAKLKLDQAALYFVQVHKTLGARVVRAATAIASLDLSRQRDTVGRVFQDVRLSGRTLNVLCANATAGAAGSAVDSAARLGEIYQGVAVAAARNDTLRGVTNSVAGSATGTVKRLDEAFRGLFRR